MLCQIMVGMYSGCLFISTFFSKAIAFLDIKPFSYLLFSSQLAFLPVQCVFLGHACCTFKLSLFDSIALQVGCSLHMGCSTCLQHCPSNCSTKLLCWLIQQDFTKCWHVFCFFFFSILFDTHPVLVISSLLHCYSLALGAVVRQIGIQHNWVWPSTYESHTL